MIRIVGVAFPFAFLLALGVASVAVDAGAGSKDAHQHHRKMLEEQNKANANFADIALPDAVLVTQDGAEVSLRSDVVGDRIVVMDFVYTTCTTVCPVLSAIFGQVQTKLDGRLGREVVMVSISVDPTRDSPARLKSYSAKHHAGDGWLWLTGPKHTVDGVLRELGAYTPNFRDHPSMVLVGDGGSGQWARFLGFPSADQIVRKVDEFSAKRMIYQSHAMREQ